MKAIRWVVVSWLIASGASAAPRGAFFLELNEEPAVRAYQRALQDAEPSRNQALVRRDAIQSARAQVQRIATQQAALRSVLAQRSPKTRELYALRHLASGLVVLADPGQCDVLQQLPGVVRVRPVRAMEPNPVAYADRFIGASPAWGWGVTNLTGAGIRLGIIDSGIDYLHADFGGPGGGYTNNDVTRADDLPGLYPSKKVAGGYDFCGDDYDGYNLPHPDDDPMDCSGHGSSVAGVAGGYGVTTNGATYAGPYGPTSPSADLRIPPGIAPGATLYALRVFGCSGSTYLVPQALDWAMDPDGDGDFADHLDVVNISIGSPFAPPDDLFAMAADEAARAGVLLALSAGNDYETYYITGSRSDLGVVVAASLADTYWTYAVRVTTPTAITGSYEAASASFGPPPASVIHTNIIYADPPLAGTPLVNAAAVSNRICLVDRGSYDFDVKVKNAQDAGARAVIVANNRAGPPSSMSGDDPTIVIPSLMISQDAANLIKAQLGTGVKAEISAATTINWSNRADTIVDYSSQGPSLTDILKPDISAPTEIMAPKTGTGQQGANFNGTSCASPVIAGVLALLRQRFPGDTVEEIKARLLGSATHDLFVATNGVPPRWTPVHAGAGRVDVTNALAANLLAYATNQPGTVHGSFGLLAAGVVTQAERQVKVVNRATFAQNVRLSYVPAADLPGADYVFPGGTNLALAAGGSTTVLVRLNASSAQLRNLRPASIISNQTTDAGSMPRYWMPEESGYLMLAPATGTPVRLVLHANVRPASALSCTSTQITLGAGSGSVNLALTGSGVNTGSGFSSNWLSAASAFGLQWRSTNAAAYARVRACGVMTDWKALQALGGNISNAWVGFAVVFSQPMPSLNGCYLEARVDLDGDDEAERLVQFGSHHLGSGDESDALGSWVYNVETASSTYQAPLHGIGPTGMPTAVYQSCAYFMLARAGDLGLSATNTSFRYNLSVWSDEWQRDQTPMRGYDVSDPGLWWATSTGMFIRPAQSGTNIVMNYNRAACTRDKLSGVLLLHHLNTPAQQAEFIPILNTNLVTGTLYVARSGSSVSPYASWATAATNPADAVNLAGDGALVLVSNGVYGLVQPVRMERGFTLRSLNGATTTVLSGRGVVRCLEMNHPGALVANLTLSNGVASYGGAVLVDAGGGGLSNCLIRNSAASIAGGGVYLTRGGLLQGCRIENNTSADRGGGVYIWQAGRLDACVLAGNRVGAGTGDGGGAFCSGGGMLLNCTGIANYASAHGGAAMLDGWGEIVGGVYSLNTGRWGGALNVSGDGEIRGVVIATNHATENGGGLVFDRGGYASNCVLRANRALDSAGGAMLYFGGGLHRSVIEQNTASWGGGLQCNGDADHGYVLGCIIRSNAVANGGGGARFWLGGIVRDCVIEYNRANQGGGVETTGNGGWVDQCVIRHNYATNAGGGIKFSNAGRVTFCEVVSNTAPYGGAANFETSGKMDGCRVFHNDAPFYGGAAYCNGGGQIHNTLMAHNTSPRGGALFIWYGGEFINCTIVSNIASIATGGTWNEGGGRYTNCIIHHNVAPAAPNYTNLGSGMAFTKVCAWPLPPGSGNFTNAPLLSFAATNFGTPLAGSPCINAGVTLPWMAGANDPYGMKRIVGPAADIGACEYPYTTSGVSAVWLMEHSLFTDGSSDYADDDGDTRNNREEWLCGTDPRDRSSALGVAQMGNSGGLVIRWHSVDGKRYRVERATNLMAGFNALVKTNILGVAPMNTETDVTAVGTGPWLYRVQLE